MPAAADGAPSARLCRLMAQLEEAEHKDAAAARRWLLAAAEADPGPAWICERCGTPARFWRALCAQCGAFDSLRWRVAPRPPAPGLAPLALPGAETAPPPVERDAAAVTPPATEPPAPATAEAIPPGMVPVPRAERPATPAPRERNEESAIDAARRVS